MYIYAVYAVCTLYIRRMCTSHLGMSSTCAEAVCIYAVYVYMYMYKCIYMPCMPYNIYIYTCIYMWVCVRSLTVFTVCTCIPGPASGPSALFFYFFNSRSYVGTQRSVFFYFFNSRSCVGTQRSLFYICTFLFILGPASGPSALSHLPDGGFRSDSLREFRRRQQRRRQQRTRSRTVDRRHRPSADIKWRRRPGIKWRRVRDSRDSRARCGV
jgi:hypothetical protein